MDKQEKFFVVNEGTINFSNRAQLLFFREYEAYKLVEGKPIEYYTKKREFI